MREIKFRAFDLEDKRMVYDIETLEFNSYGVCKVTNQDDVWFFVKQNESIRFPNCELMQFIGFSDRNGKEIFEGDIIQYDYFGDDGDLQYSNMQIFWNDKIASFCYDDSSRSDKTSYQELNEEFCKEVRVVGNIHENPELLADAVCRPILFSTPMVQSILEGRKAQTRRLFKVNNQTVTADEENVFFDVEMGEAVYNSMGGKSWWRCPYGNVGDILWVRETFYEPLFEKLNGKYYYKADLEKQGWDFKWKPSMFMPKDACRLFLEITNIRCERLQDITNDDSIKEGILPLNMSSSQLSESGQLYFDYSKLTVCQSNPPLYRLIR